MAKSKALGRGLGALLGEIEEAYDNEVPKQYTVLEIPLSQIKPNPFQPRKSFDEKSLQELSESIKEHGLLQPIVVVEDIDGYVLVAGERRLRASKLAKLKTIRAVAASIDESQMRQHALIENIQRDELNIIDLAHAYDELLKVHGITHDELSAMVHKSRTHITNTLRLLQLSKKTRAVLIDGKITAGHAKVLVGLSDKEQQLMVNSIIGQKLSVREVEMMVKKMKAAPSADNAVPPAAATTDFNFKPLQKHLNDAGFNSTVKSNKVTVEFKDEADLETFLNYFK
ncbi:MAG: ParB/RepB/Spo0J family partition protein [Campylobacterota bacterium]|nr:ParB/RepB/Spo0J family partition protein [Campylobacterota bacterium]